MVTMRGVSVAPALRAMVVMLLYATITVLVVNGSDCRAAPVLAAAAQDKEASEAQKLNLEIQKLKSDVDWWWLTPVLAAGSILGSAAVIVWQVRASSRDRDKNAKNEAILKLAEFVLDSRQPAMARERLNILERIDRNAFGDRENLAKRILVFVGLLNRENLAKRILLSMRVVDQVKDASNQISLADARRDNPDAKVGDFIAADFPSVERHELKVEVLRLIAADPTKGKQIVEASINIFPKEEKWLKKLDKLYS